jgi:hypothetical protein
MGGSCIILMGAIASAWAGLQTPITKPDTRPVTFHVSGFT